jgi:hypothetical protein
MSQLADAIRLKWLARINEISGSRTERLDNWILSGNYQFHVTQQKITQLVFFNPDPILNAMAGDIDRFSMAAFESLALAKEGVVEKLPKGKAWNLIAIYYAGFFAANALLRVMGISCNYFYDQIKQAIELQARLTTLPGQAPPAVPKGMYRLEVDVNNSAVALENLSSSGSHESLWACFDRSLDSLERFIHSQQLELQFSLALTQINSLKRCLTKPGIGVTRAGSLSAIRNTINYRQEHGVWFPYKDLKSANNVRDVKKIVLIDTDKLNLYPKGSGLDQMLVETSLFLISLCKDVVVDLDRRCIKRPCFVKYGALRLLNLLDAQY